LRIQGSHRLKMSALREFGRASRLIEAARFVFPLAWQSNRRLSAWQLAATIVTAVMTPTLVVLLGGAVTQIEAGVSVKDADSWVLNVWVTLAGVSALLIAMSEAVRKYCRQRLTDEVRLRVNHRVFSHAASFDLQTLEQCQTQDSLSRAVKDPGMHVLEASNGVLEVGSSVIQTVVLAGVLIWIEPRWSLLLGLLAIPHLVAQWYLSRATAEQVRSRTTALRWGNYYSKILTDAQQLPTIRLLGLGTLFLDRLQATISATLEASRRLYSRRMLFQLGATLLTIAALCLVISLVGRAAQQGAISVGAFVTYWSAAWRLRASLSRLTEALALVFDGYFAVENIREFLSLRSSLATGAGVARAVRGRIECRGATYQFPGAARPAVDDVTLTIEPGEIVALVGPNGAGKTTLARMICRLYDPTKGAIEIDGVDLKDWDAANLHQQMSVVFQEPVRFEATALENVAFGDWPRLHDQPDKVREWSQKTGLDATLAALPNGYDTHLGRKFGETDLSGGQWRRLAVTQALARDPRIIVLDEPYANLDPIAEEELYQSVQRLLMGLTAVLISHRFTTLQLAHRIVVLDAATSSNKARTSNSCDGTGCMPRCIARRWHASIWEPRRGSVRERIEITLRRGVELGELVGRH
jgi:ABC-type multidrug transport system fused ATPase/permease subunit